MPCMPYVIVIRYRPICKTGDGMVVESDPARPFDSGTNFSMHECVLFLWCSVWLVIVFNVRYHILYGASYTEDQIWSNLDQYGRPNSEVISLSKLLDHSLPGTTHHVSQLTDFSVVTFHLHAAFEIEHDKGSIVLMQLCCPLPRRVFTCTNAYGSMQHAPFQLLGPYCA